MSISVTVNLLSGTHATVTLPTDATVADLRQKAQRALQTPLGKLTSASGTLLGGFGTLTQSGVHDGDTITAVTRAVAVAASYRAFALIRADGSVVTWGCPDSGGDSNAVQHNLHGVLLIQAAEMGFAALREDGVVVSWGNLAEEDESLDVDVHSCSLPSEARDVRQIQAATHAFAAIKEDGSVITWGRRDAGGDSSEVRDPKLQTWSLKLNFRKPQLIPKLPQT